MKQIILFLMVGMNAINAFSQMNSFHLQEDSIPIILKDSIFYGNEDDGIHLRIIDTITNKVCYDSIAIVRVKNGFTDTIYLKPGVYKCLVLSIGANVSMPSVILNNGKKAI